MNFWTWVASLHHELTASGQERTANLLLLILIRIKDNKLAELEALLPEALAAARALKNPWLEIFLRHWNMNLRCGQLGEGEIMLPEAVSLLEFANREGNRDCPQSVCATGDIAACYANIDGPGWAEERKAVCREILDRITPEWPCYMCMGHHYADALRDEGKHAEALEWATKIRDDILAVEGEKDFPALRHKRVEMMLALRDLDAARTELDAADAMDYDKRDESDRRWSKLLRARLLALSGRYDEAWSTLPPWDASLPPADYESWIHTATIIAQADPAYNTWQWGRLLYAAQLQAHAVGAHRRAMVTGGLHCVFALFRGATATARRALKLMEQALPKLRAPLGADTIIADLRQRIAAFSPPPLPVPVSELAAWFEEQTEPDPEEHLEILLQAMEQEPLNASFIMYASRILEACGAGDEARELIWRALRAAPAELGEHLVLQLIQIIPTHDAGSLLELAGFIDGHIPALGHWCRAHVAYNAKRWKEAGEHLAKMLEEKPDNWSIRRFWADAAMHDKDFPTALRLRKDALELMRATGEDLVAIRWEVLTAAGAAREWDLVREISKDLGFPVSPGQGVIEEAWSLIRLRYMEQGEEVDYLALRTGPVTARVLEVAPPGRRQYVDDWVVFDPTSLEQFPEDEEERERFHMPYTPIHVLEPGNCAIWIVNGAKPTDEHVNAFIKTLIIEGYRISVCSSPYWVLDPDVPKPARDAEPDASDASRGREEPEGLPGIRLAVSMPKTVDPAEMDRRLTELTADWAHPVSWLELATAARSDVKRHKDIMARYGLQA